MKYLLTTRIDGVEHFVKEGDMPRFSVVPDLLLWGSRAFKFLKVENGTWHFTEAFTFHVLEKE